MVGPGDPSQETWSRCPASATLGDAAPPSAYAIQRYCVCAIIQVISFGLWLSSGLVSIFIRDDVSAAFEWSPTYSFSVTYCGRNPYRGPSSSCILLQRA